MSQKNYNSDIDAFCALLRAGLWEKEVRLLQFVSIDYSQVLNYAEEQSVVGLVTAGLEHVIDVKPSKVDVLQFVGQTLQLEKQNTAMNNYIGVLIEKLRQHGINTILVKGQGIAQCYERPLWRSCGDIDLFLSNENYKRAQSFLIPMSTSHDEELTSENHIAMTIDSWLVELHGSLPSHISSRADKVLKKVQDRVFCEEHVCSCTIGDTTVFLMHPDEDVIFVFTHVLKHYFRGGIGLRQICDWCRLLWSEREMIDHNLLAVRLNGMRFMTEWKAFASMAVEFLGMPAEAMPFYEQSESLSKKAQQILDCILEVGSFGKNREGKLRMNQPSFLKRKWIAFKYKLKDFLYHFRAFPVDSLRVLFADMTYGVISTLKHEG